MNKLAQIVEVLKSKEIGWKQNLFFLVLAQFIAMVGMSACVPFLPLYIRQLGITDINEAKFWSGIVFAGPYILSIFAVPVWGVLGDRYGRKKMVIRAILGLAVAMYFMGYSQNVWQLFLLRVFQGAVSGFIAASLAFVSAETPSNRSGYAISMLQGAQSAGGILGPLFGGVISDLVGIRPVFYIVGILCLISGITIIVFVKEKGFTPSPTKQNSIVDNIKYLGSSKELIYLMIFIITSQAGIQFTAPIFPFFVETLDAPVAYLSTITGLLIGVTGVFSIIFTPQWGRRNDRKDYRKTLKVSSLVVGIATILQLFVTHYLLLFPLRIVIGIFLGAIVPTLYTAINKRCEHDNIGGIMGIASSANLLGALISFLSVSIIASSFGNAVCFIIAGVLLLSINIMMKIGKI